MNLKESGKRHMGGLEGKKMKGEILQSNYKLKKSFFFVLSENPGSVLSTHIVTHNHL